MGVCAKTLGARICQFRHQRRLSQQQLARLIGVQRSNISRLECGGGGTPTLGVLDRVAVALGVSIFALLETNVETQDPLIAEISKLLPRLNTEQRQILLSHTRHLALKNRAKEAL